MLSQFRAYSTDFSVKTPLTARKYREQAVYEVVVIGILRLVIIAPGRLVETFAADRKPANSVRCEALLSEKQSEPKQARGQEKKRTRLRSCNRSRKVKETVRSTELRS
jgi:hypothetical protein